jgi:hypothetical protein
MDFLRTINNNFKYDIWGNFLMCRQLGPKAGCEFLARKSMALARAVISGRTVTVNNRTFFDTWS